VARDVAVLVLGVFGVVMFCVMLYVLVFGVMLGGVRPVAVCAAVATFDAVDVIRPRDCISNLGNKGKIFLSPPIDVSESRMDEIEHGHEFGPKLACLPPCTSNAKPLKHRRG
jgi:hypothetical protein